MLHIPGKILKSDGIVFSFERGQKFVFFHFDCVFLLRFRHQVNDTKVTNDEVFKSVRENQKLIGM